MRRITLLALALLACAACRRHGRGHAAKRGGIALDLVPLPEGTFAMGSNGGDEDERPVHDEHVAAFAIGRTEVTVAQYAKCVAAGACTTTAAKPYCNEHAAGRADHPINCVTWAQATAFCAWAGARLPSEAEWEYAARGADGRAYPWGDASPDATRLCWDGAKSDLGVGKRRGTCPVGSHPAGASPFGAKDMAGDVWEWTSSPYSSAYDAPPQDALRVARGGTWLTYDPNDVRATLRFPLYPSAENYGVGFRCAR